MPEIRSSTLDEIIKKIKQKDLEGAVYYEKYPPASYQSGPSCGIYSLKWAIDYRAIKTGKRGELLPARARDVCANCGAEIRQQGADRFATDVVAIREGQGEKKFYYCAVCAALPERKRGVAKTMRSLAKANGLSIMGELMEPPKLLQLAELSGFRDEASLIDVAKKGKSYDECLKQILEAGKMALLIYDINPANGGPGKNGGTKAHWCVVFGYYNEKAKPLHLLAVHGWGKFYDWEMSELLSCLDQMKVHPGWDLRVPTQKNALDRREFVQNDPPSSKKSYKRDGVTVIPPLDKNEASVNVPGTDYTNFNKQFISFG